MNFALSVVRTMSGIAFKLATAAARAKAEIHFKPRLFTEETRIFLSVARRSALPFQRMSEVGAGLGVIRLQAEGFLKLTDRLVQPALPAQGDAEAVVGDDVIRFEPEGFLKLADRLVGLTFLGQGHTEVVVGGGIIRDEADGGLELADRLVQPALLE